MSKDGRRVHSMAFTDTDELQKQLSLMENDTGMPLARGLKKGAPPSQALPGGRPPPSLSLPQGGAPPRGGAPPGMVKGGGKGGMVKGGAPGLAKGGALGSKVKGVAPKKRRAMPVDENGDVVFPPGSAAAQITAAGSKSMYQPSTAAVSGSSHSMYEGLGGGGGGGMEKGSQKLLLGVKKEEKREGGEGGGGGGGFMSQSTYDLGAMTRRGERGGEGGGNMGGKKLSLWTVRPSPSAGLSSGNNNSNNNKGVSCAMIDSLLAKVRRGEGGGGAPVEVKEHPMEWCKLGGGGKEEDYLFTFMGQHGLKFKDDCPQLNQALEKWRKMKGGDRGGGGGGGLGERVEAASIAFQGDKETGEPFVRSGKVNVLFLLLVDPLSRRETPFSTLEMTFFFTFPLFADYDMVLSMFCSVIQLHLGEGEAKKTGGKEELKAVVEALKHWASLIPEDLIDPPPLGRRSYGGGKDILQNINCLLSLCGASSIIPVSYTDRNYRFVNEFRKFQPPPKPMLPVNVRDKLSLLNIEPLEVARQLTIHSFSVFESINPREWLTPGGGGGGTGTGIGEMSEEFNRVSNFMAERILESGEVEVRAEMMNKCVFVADELLGMKNFHSFMAVMCAFNSAPILRLQKTWKAFRKGWKEGFSRYGELCQIGEMEGNFGQLRKLSTRRSDSPMIPYLGLSLSDITFILDGNKHSPVPLDHVNFEMLTMIGKVIIQIRTSQLIPYNFEVVPFVMEYLFDRPTSDQNKLYNTSLKHEPRLSKEDAAKPKSMNSSFRRLSGFFAQGEIESKFKLFDSKSSPDTSSEIITNPPSSSSSSSSTSEPTPHLLTSPTEPMNHPATQPEKLPVGLGGGGAGGGKGRGGGEQLHMTVSEPAPALAKGRAPTLPRGRAPGCS